MDRPRLVRGLRIAWTAVFGILCVLLILLWVRSYWSVDYVDTSKALHNWHVASRKGEILISESYSPPPPVAVRRWDWNFNYEWYYKQNFPERVLLGFQFHHGWDGKRTTVPYWFPVVLSALPIALVWLPWKFSLRTLLIATTFIAVMLGLATYATR